MYFFYSENHYFNKILFHFLSLEQDDDFNMVGADDKAASSSAKPGDFMDFELF